MWRICTLGLLAVAVWALAPFQRATAQILAPLTVTRGPGAESCPDLDRLAGQVVQLGGGGHGSDAGAYAVAFSRTPDGFQASIRGGGGSARVLEDRGPDCRALEQATAITLALLRDSDASEASSRHDEPVVPAPKKPARQPASASGPHPASPARASDGPKRTSAALNWILSAGGAGLFGVVRPVAPALEVEAGASFGRVRAHLGALGMLPQTLRFEPGTLHESLLSGVARGCVVAARGVSIRFDLCSGLYGGRIRTEARGYTRDSSARKIWITIPIELALVRTTRRFWGELGVSALIPLQSTDFSIDGLGRAYRSPPIGGLVSLRIAYVVGP